MKLSKYLLSFTSYFKLWELLMEKSSFPMIQFAISSPFVMLEVEYCSPNRCATGRSTHHPASTKWEFRIDSYNLFIHQKQQHKRSPLLEIQSSTSSNQSIGHESFRFAWISRGTLITLVCSHRHLDSIRVNFNLQGYTSMGKKWIDSHCSANHYRRDD